MKQHKPYFTYCAYVSFGLMGIYQLLAYIGQMINLASKGQWLTDLVLLIFSEILIIFRTLLWGIPAFILVVLVSFIPYAIVRGIMAPAKQEIR